MSLYEKLYEELPEKGIQKTDGRKTNKGYDTTGYGYQWCVDRFNSVCGVEGWSYDYKILRESSGKFKTGKPFHDVTVEVTITIENASYRKCVGGHISILYADALKGAITNAFKKTAAFYGVGSAAYRGQLDDDNNPLPDHPSAEKTEKPPKVTPMEEPENEDLIETLNEIADGLDLTDDERTKHAVYLTKYKNNREALEKYLNSIKKRRDDERMDEAADAGFIDDDPAEGDLPDMQD